MTVFSFGYNMNDLFPRLAAVIWGGNTVVTKLYAASLSPVEISCRNRLLASVFIAMVGEINNIGAACIDD
jgi:hypothetical protein